MARSDITERLTRIEQNSKDIKDFLESGKPSLTIYLYSSEIRRLKKEFPQIEIEKGDLFKPQIRLHTCTVRRK